MTSQSRAERRPQRVMAKQNLERLLDKTREELPAATQLLKEKKARAKRGRSKLVRDNAKRAAKLVKGALSPFVMQNLRFPRRAPEPT
jgi:hypothetical protein